MRSKRIWPCATLSKSQGGPVFLCSTFINFGVQWFSLRPSQEGTELIYENFRFPETGLGKYVIFGRRFIYPLKIEKV